MVFRSSGDGKNQHGKAGNDIIESSHELKKRSFVFWLKAFTATFLSWTSRYWVVNAILVAFFSVSDHLLIFARQLATWVMMLISPSPGGSGFAELILGRYITDQIPLDPARGRKYCTCNCSYLENTQLLSLSSHRRLYCSWLDREEICQTCNKKDIVQSLYLFFSYFCANHDKHPG